MPKSRYPAILLSLRPRRVFKGTDSRAAKSCNQAAADRNNEQAISMFTDTIPGPSSANEHFGLDSLLS
jgi:hypothetical protein